MRSWATLFLVCFLSWISHGFGFSNDCLNQDKSDALKDPATEPLLDQGFCPIDANLRYGSQTHSVAEKSNDAVDGGWSDLDATPEARHLIQAMSPYDALCDLDRRRLDGPDALTSSEFLHRYAYRQPVVLLRHATDNLAFKRLTTKDALLRDYGDYTIRLSTANTHSYTKVDTTLSHYFSHYLKPQCVEAGGNETFYWFGDNNVTEFRRLFDAYQVPALTLPGAEAAFSFGVAGPGTGVPFHWHGPGFAEVIYGRKLWMLQSPSRKPEFDPDTTTLRWLLNDLDRLSQDDRPSLCSIGPGEVIYFPDRWWHATLNSRTSVFISTFLSS